MGRTQGSGRGSIYKRGDKWRGQITIQGKRMSYTSAKKKDVIDWMDQVKTDPNKRVDQSNITIRELAERWIEKEKRPTLAEQSCYQLELSFGKHLYPYLGDEKLQNITREDIEKFYRKSFAGNFADSTIQIFAKRFEALLEYAIKEEILATNPHKYVIVPRTHKKRKVEAYTKEDQVEIIKYLKQNITPCNMLFYLMLSTGVRVSEAAALTVGDLDFKTGGLSINKIVVQFNDGTSIQDHPKTASSTRVVYLSDKPKEIMRSYCANKRSDEILFPNTRGRLYTAGDLRSRWIKACNQIGIEYKGLHALRHTFATRALEKGIDIKTVSAMLGHKSVVTTMNIYQDVYSAQKVKAAEIMDDLF